MADFNNNYTGRQIAIFTDIHGLLEPTIAILNDIRAKGITEIYSLGDAIGAGPNPSQVLDLLGEYGVKQINGNSEEYSIIGIEPFKSYFNGNKIASQEWTYSQLTSEQLNDLKKNEHSYDLLVGGEKIALCHFANDVRIDFGIHSTWSYQGSINSGLDNPNEQFYYTNSEKQKRQINVYAERNYSIDKGFVSAKKDPIFGGKPLFVENDKGEKISTYSEIIQGHVHFKFLTEDEITKIRTIRAVGMAYGNNPIDLVSYIIIKEKEHGYDVEEILVPFQRDKMLKSIDGMPEQFQSQINKFVSR